MNSIHKWGIKAISIFVIWAIWGTSHIIISIIAISIAIAALTIYWILSKYFSDVNSPKLIVPQGKFYHCSHSNFQLK